MSKSTSISHALSPLDMSEDVRATGRGAAVFLGTMRPWPLSLAAPAGLLAVPVLREATAGAPSDMTLCRAAFMGPASEAGISAKRLRFCELLLAMAG